MSERRKDKAEMDEINALRQDMKKLRSDFEGVLRSADGQKDKGSNDGMSADIGEVLSQLRHRLDSLQSQIKEKGGQSVANMEQRIQDRPFQSTAIAFIVGLIFGYFMDRRMHH